MQPKCPKCGGWMKEVPANVRFTLPSRLSDRPVEAPPNAYACEKCGYVEFYILPSP